MPLRRGLSAAHGKPRGKKADVAANRGKAIGPVLDSKARDASSSAVGTTDWSVRRICGGRLK